MYCLVGKPSDGERQYYLIHFFFPLWVFLILQYVNKGKGCWTNASLWEVGLCQDLMPCFWKAYLVWTRELTFWLVPFALFRGLESEQTSWRALVWFCILTFLKRCLSSSSSSGVWTCIVFYGETISECRLVLHFMVLCKTSSLGIWSKYTVESESVWP